jgi:hypothetical protein
METVSSNPQQYSKMQQVKQQVEEVKHVMMSNIEQVLERGDRIELLVDKTEDLRFQVRFGWEMRFLPFDPLVKPPPYRGLHVRRESVSVVPRSRAILCRILSVCYDSHFLTAVLRSCETKPRSNGSRIP